MKKKIIDELSRIVSNKRAGYEYFEIILESSRIAYYSAPGQFIEVKVSSSMDPLLRRPFSIHKIGIRDTGYGMREKKGLQTQKCIGVLYQVVGKATEMLSQKRPGDYLDIIGPLGNGFSFLTPNSKLRTPVLIAGGMGVAPLLFLAERLVHRPCLAGRQAQSTVYGKPLVVIGAKTKDGILCEKDFKKLGCDVQIATDDGSQGFKGRVTDLLERILSTMDRGPSTIYACGPKLMLKAVTHISKQYSLSAQVSLEAHMACGIGACLGCVVNTTGGFKRVCKDGPVFKAEEIIW